MVDDKDLDDAALWAVIDSAVASYSKSRKPLAIKCPNFHSPPPPNPISNASPPLKLPKTTRNPSYSTEPSDSKGEVLEEPWVFRPPRKIARTSSSEISQTSPLVLVRNVQHPTPVYSTPEKYLSPEIGRFTGSECSPATSQEKESSAHCLSGMFPSVSLFKQYQNAAMAVISFHISCA